jgi:glycosyltransferase involved in cell wall biosynthesis
MPVIKTVITSLDNLPLLKEQVRVLQNEPLISEIIVVSNGSRDGTNEWLANQDVAAILRENKGAGPGRNAGLDAAGEFDYVLLLDGGIRPLIGGVEKMLDYLERHPATENRFNRVNVLGIEIPHFETDKTKAWRRWPKHLDIRDPGPPPPPGTCQAYHNWRLSQTAYCLARKEAWDGLRFSEEGPFGEPGWGADDDEMMYQWRDAGIIVHAVCNVHPYRLASGSFRRLFLETGVWPTQYGSIYEKRLVWLQQNWPQYGPGVQWDKPWITIVIEEPTPKLIKAAHDLLRKRTFDPPYDYAFNSYSIVAWNGDEDFLKWAASRRLRQHHGDATIVNGQIIRRSAKNEDEWTGDFRLWSGDNWKDAIRPDAHYHTLIKDQEVLEKIVEKYNAIFPKQPTNHTPPKVREELDVQG